MKERTKRMREKEESGSKQDLKEFSCICILYIYIYIYIYIPVEILDYRL